MTSIRPANVSDVARMEQLWQDELFYPPDPHAVISAYVEECPAFIAEQEDAVQGFAYSREFSKDVLELNNILVATTARSGGVGTELVAHVEQAAQQLGFAAIILSNSQLFAGREKRSPATFYQRLGFRTVAATEHTTVWYKDIVAK